jgi:hypothetical protein
LPVLLPWLSVAATSEVSLPAAGLLMEGTRTRRIMTKPITKSEIKTIKQPLALLII